MISLSGGEPFTLLFLSPTLSLFLLGIQLCSQLENIMATDSIFLPPICLTKSHLMGPFAVSQIPVTTHISYHAAVYLWQGVGLQCILCLWCIFHDVLLTQNGVKASFPLHWRKIPLPAVLLSCLVDRRMIGECIKFSWRNSQSLCGSFPWGLPAAWPCLTTQVTVGFSSEREGEKAVKQT